jgi:hypothetical protein
LYLLLANNYSESLDMSIWWRARTGGRRVLMNGEQCQYNGEQIVFRINLSTRVDLTLYV